MADRESASEDMVPVGMYTETLARLYMRQGHVDKALRIYRYLAAQQPSDPDLQDQIHALEHQLTIASDMGSDTVAQALPIPVDWPPAQEANSYMSLPAPQSSQAAQSSQAPQADRKVLQTQQVIAQLERWLQVLRYRTS